MFGQKTQSFAKTSFFLLYFVLVLRYRTTILCFCYSFSTSPKKSLLESLSPCTFVSSSPTSFKPEALWHKDEVYDLKPTSYKNCSSFASNVVIVEDFDGANKYRNIITTHQKEDKSYNKLTKEQQVNKFYVSRLSCEWMKEWFDHVQIDIKSMDLKKCKEDRTSRAKWFQAFAFEYAVSTEGAMLPKTTCFIDLSDEAQISASKTVKDCQMAHSTLPRRMDCDNSAVSEMKGNHWLTPESRKEYKMKIETALKLKPEDMVHPSQKCSFFYPFDYSKECWMHTYIASNFPEFQIGIFGEHGAGKSTFLQWLAYYGNVANKDEIKIAFAQVCPPSSGTCSEFYQRARYSPSSWFYDTKGLDNNKLKNPGDAVNEITQIIRGELMPVGCEMKKKQVSSNFFYNTSKALQAILVFGVLLGVFHSYRPIESKQTSIMWAIICTIFIFLIGYFIIHGHDIVPECYQDRNGKYIMSQHEKQSSTLHSIAYISPFPSDKATFQKNKEIFNQLRKTLKSKNSLRTFAVGISDLSSCSKNTIQCCRKSYENKIAGILGRTFMLDSTDLSLDQKNKLIEIDSEIETLLDRVSPTGKGYLEPDQSSISSFI